MQGRIHTVNLSTEEPADPDKALRPPYLPLPTEAVQQPNLLLRAIYGVVPFVGRKEHLAKLREWATDDPMGALGLITGPGGSGKSRLAAELADGLRREGYVSGILRPRPAALGLAGLVKSTPGVIVVVDEAESRILEVLDLLELLAELPGG